MSGIMSGMSTASRNIRVQAPSIHVSLRGEDGTASHVQLWREDYLIERDSPSTALLVMDFAEVHDPIYSVDGELEGWQPTGNLWIAVQRVERGNRGVGVARPFTIAAVYAQPDDPTVLPRLDFDHEPVSPRRSDAEGLAGGGSDAGA